MLHPAITVMQQPIVRASRFHSHQKRVDRQTCVERLVHRPADYSAVRTADFAVVRYNPNGALDTTFNGTGKVTIAFCCQEFTSEMAIQTDGKIVVAGATDDMLYDFYDFVVVRYQGDAPPAAYPNPIDCAEFFVRQHYLDFLNREPDPPASPSGWVR